MGTADWLKGCGMRLGYMFWDLMVLIFDARDQMRAYGRAQHGVTFPPFSVSPHGTSWCLVCEP